MTNFKDLTGRIRIWAKTRGDIRAVIVVGSQARREPPADEFSDLDLVLFTPAAGAYAQQDGWLQTLGAPWLAVCSTTGRGDPEWMVVFAGGAKVDFVFANLAQELDAAPLAAILQDSPYGFVYQRGVKVLFDRENPGNEESLLSFPLQPPPDPTADEFSQVVQRFLLQALRAARFLRRGETWRAAILVNGEMKNPYLTMLEWHAGGALQTGRDPWYEGHFLEQWADPRAVRELPGLFAACTPEALWEALFASLEAMRWIAMETASQLGVVYPVTHEQPITRLIQSLRDD